MGLNRLIFFSCPLDDRSEYLHGATKLIEKRDELAFLYAPEVKSLKSGLQNDALIDTVCTLDQNLFDCKGLRGCEDRRLNLLVLAPAFDPNPRKRFFS